MPNAPTSVFIHERDALAVLGLLAHAYLTWDPPVPVPGTAEFTHHDGLNIQALVVHNASGSVLSIAKNAIHATEDPTRHAEPAAIRAALAELHTRDPRASGTTVEDYYRSHLFYAAGADEHTYARQGCSLYTTLEPCPMCASTLCVARMKQVVFVIDDKKFGGGFPMIQSRFYSRYDLRYRQAAMHAVHSALIASAENLRANVLSTTAQLRTSGVQDTWFLDQMHGTLARALDLLLAAAPASLVTTGEERDANVQTLTDLKRLLRLPA